MRRSIIIASLLLTLIISITSIVLYATVWKEDDAFDAFWGAPYNIWVWSYVGGESNGNYFIYTVHYWDHGDTSYGDWTATYDGQCGGSPYYAWTYAEGYVYYLGAGSPVDNLQAYASIFP